MSRAPIRRRTLLAGAAALCASSAALAQSYPDKPLRWVVGFPPGGGTDVLARTVAAQMSTQMRQQVLVDNRAGAAGMIAAENVAHAAADGYTLLSADIAILTFNPAIYRKVRYDALKDFAPVGLMARFPLLITTRPGSGVQSIQQLVAQARKGNALSYGSAGVGTPHHLAMEVMLSTVGGTAQHVPYKGDAPALQDVAGGQVPVAVVAPSLSLPYIKEGKLVALAVTSDRRLPQLPDVPTLKELGYAPVPVYAWQGLVVPAATPAPVVATLSRELQAALATAEVRHKLSDLGMEAIPGPAAEMRRYIVAEKQFWEPLIAARNIRAD